MAETSVVGVFVAHAAVDSEILLTLMTLAGRLVGKAVRMPAVTTRAGLIARIPVALHEEATATNLAKPGVVPQWLARRFEVRIQSRLRINTNRGSSENPSRVGRANVTYHGRTIIVVFDGVQSDLS